MTNATNATNATFRRLSSEGYWAATTPHEVAYWGARRIAHRARSLGEVHGLATILKSAKQRLGLYWAAIKAVWPEVIPAIIAVLIANND